jgi:hypothetical protein
MVSPSLFIGTILIAAALLLLYYFRSRPKRHTQREDLRDKETQLRDIIKNIRADYYRRKISQAEANRLLVGYEGELRQVLRKIELWDAIEKYSTGKETAISKEKQNVIVAS